MTILTEPGWPRPWHPDQYGTRRPTPWITVLPNFATIHPGRRERMVEDRLCQVCGLGHEPGAEVIVFQAGRLRDKATGGELHLGPDFEVAAHFDQVAIALRDAALLHERCARLAVRHCPALSRWRESHALFAFAGPLDALMVFKDSDEAKDGEVVDLVVLDGARARIWEP